MMSAEGWAQAQGPEGRALRPQGQETQGRTRFGPDGMRVRKKWWWNEDERAWVRAGFIVECQHGDLQTVCRSTPECQAVRRQHLVDCVSQPLF